MKRKGGFTLVELLVVMAIIAILASIVVPNVVGFIKKSRAVKAHSEIGNIQLALGKMLADANRNSLREFFDQAAIDTDLGARTGSDRLDREQLLFTRTMYALLREGRQALADGDEAIGSGFMYTTILNDDVVKKLGTEYMPLGFDPWGNLYQIYPGPWSSSSYAQAGIPIIFRITDSPETENKTLPGNKAGVQEDGLTVNVVDAVSEETFRAGYSAPLQETAYIWSYGENTVNDQATKAADGATGLAAYDNADEIFKGGGDDVNSWDKERTWERFYN